MREERDRAPGGLAALLIVRRLDQERRHHARRDEHHAHDCGRSEEQLARVRDAALGFAVRSRVVAFVLLAAADQRHHRHAGFESAQPERELGKHEHGARDQHGRVALGAERRAPVGEERGVREDLEDAAPEHDHVQQQVGHGCGRRKADRLGEALQKDRGQYEEDCERHENLMLAERFVEIRVLDRVFGGVGG